MAKADSLADEVARQKRIAAWVTVLGCFLVLFTTGHFQYSFGVFVKPMIDMFGWSRAAISSIVTMRSVTTALVSPLVGTLTDRYGSRKLLLLGVFFFGVGYVLASRATSLWQFYLTFGLLVGLSNAVVVGPAVTAVTKWFGGKSARANGITMSGLSMAQTVFPPIAAYLVGGYGWGTSLVILGVATCAVGTLSWTFVRNPPEFRPDTDGDPARPHSTGRDYTLREALRTRSFWTIFAIHVVVAVCFQMVAVHVVVAAVDHGAAAGAAAAILTVVGGSSTLGRSMLSGVADWIGGKTLIAVAMALGGAALLVLASTTELPGFYVAAAVFGLLYGSVMPLIPSLTGSLFGTRFMGSIFGVMNISYLGGAAVGPLIGGYIFDVTGSYYAAFSLAAGLAGLAFLLCLTLKVPRQTTAEPLS